MLSGCKSPKTNGFQERIRQRHLKIHEKTTYTTRINFKTPSTIRPADSDDSDEKKDDEEDDGKGVTVKDDPQFTIAVTRGGCEGDGYCCRNYLFTLLS